MRVKKRVTQPEKKLTYKNFVNKRFIQGTAGLVSVATIAFLINKYMKNGSTREEAGGIGGSITVTIDKPISSIVFSK
jgi:GTPase involved in cell partitioning and DNA repair